MIIKQITSEGLGHHSYFFADSGQAIVIDPKRDIDTYLELEKETQCKIVKVLETHRNEDYVIGSIALHARTNAEILHGQGIDFRYGTGIGDRNTFKISNYLFQALETPGHTPESLTFTVSDLDFSTKPFAAFVGDSLFVGTTGRTDLWGKPDEAPGALFDSLYNRILSLDEHTIIYPSHGSGSVCGVKIASRNITTLGYELKYNPKLQVSSKSEFISLQNKESRRKAPYFTKMEEWNRCGSAPLIECPQMIAPVCASEIYTQTDNISIIDCRSPQAFAGGHIPGSINIWQNGLSSYMGWIAPLYGKITLILPDNSLIDTISRQLQRIGFDNADAFLYDGFNSWQSMNYPIEKIELLTVEDFIKMRKQDDVRILDVRNEEEWCEGIIKDSLKIFLGEIPQIISDLDRTAKYICVCSSGNRSSIAASILKQAGIDKVYNLLGGYSAWKENQKSSRQAA